NSIAGKRLHLILRDQEIIIPRKHFTEDSSTVRIIDTTEHLDDNYTRIWIEIKRGPIADGESPLSDRLGSRLLIKDHPFFSFVAEVQPPAAIVSCRDKPHKVIRNSFSVENSLQAGIEVGGDDDWKGEIGLSAPRANRLPILEQARENKMDRIIAF